MIFATVGSHPSFAFERLLRALESVRDQDLVVQHGPGRPPANAREAVPFMSFEEMLDRMSDASIVVCHAGVGSILCSLQVGHVPVVMARKARFRETVDDHQVELADALAPSGRIILALDGDSLADAIDAARIQKTVSLGHGGGLVGAVRDELQCPPRAARRGRPRGRG